MQFAQKGEKQKGEKTYRENKKRVIIYRYNKCISINSTLTNSCNDYLNKQASKSYPHSYPLIHTVR